MTRTSSIMKIGGGAAGLALLLVILIALNAALGAYRIRADLTQDKLYTLSDGTRAVLDKLGPAVTLKFFFTSSSPEIPAPVKNFAREVEDLLREYELAAPGKIVIEKYDPKPDTEVEEWAARYGLPGQPVSMTGPDLYLGLVATCGAEHDTIPFLDPRKERLMEYDITRLIARVSNRSKPVVGVMSSLPVMGDPEMPFMMPGQPRPESRPPWVAFQELSRDFDVRRVEINAEEIGEDIDVLVAVHPKNLSEETLFAIDQFVLRGGRLLAFLDPMCLAETFLAADPGQMPPSPTVSSLGPLPAAWGVEFPADKVLADLAASTPVNQGANKVVESPVFLTLRQRNMGEGSTITAQLQSLLAVCSGAFSHSPPEGLEIEQLIVSSRQSQLMDAMAVQMGDEWVRREFTSGDESHAIALRLTGTFTTAFPDGKPDYGTEESEEGDEAPRPEALARSAKPTSVILVADADMLFDSFTVTVQELSFFGQNVYQPINDNISLLMSAVEQLAGGVELAAIRARGRVERPFDKVLAIQREAQKRWLAEERSLQKQLDATRQRLSDLQSERDKSQRFILSPEQQAEIERFRQEEIRTQMELRNVRRKLREDIERLGVKVKAFNILFVPALVCIVGISLGLYRQRRTGKCS